MQTHRTTHCGQFAHPEVTLQLLRPVPIPSVETMLLRYFEEAVADGTRFRDGETVRLGWSTLKLRDRDDGTLGVLELDLAHLPQWHESVSDTLLEAWRQQEVVKSLTLPQGPDFPSQLGTAVACTQWRETLEFLLSRAAYQAQGDSGWFIGCTDPQHDHEEASNLEQIQLIEVAARVSPLAQFLALPVGCEVLVRGPGRVRAQVWHDGRELSPVAGSYLAALG